LIAIGANSPATKGSLKVPETSTPDRHQTATVALEFQGADHARVSHIIQRRPVHFSSLSDLRQGNDANRHHPN
jgi:hypothetical protein